MFLVYYKIIYTNSADGLSYMFDAKTGSDEVKTCPGRLVFPISPDTVVLAEKVVYSISKSPLHDIGLSLTSRDENIHQENNIVQVNDTRVKCYHCAALVHLKDMRKHVGRHMLNQTLINEHSVTTCGFCGRNICSNELVVSSHKKGNVYYKLKSNCSYAIKPKKGYTTYSGRNTCSNGVIKCKICKADIWKYNIRIHYSEVHTNTSLPEDLIISDVEKGVVLN